MKKDSNIVEKNIKIETKEKSFLYVFSENDNETKLIKIGVATHNKTDTSIESWRKYAESKHPVTIERRITDLQTGNPRKIEPLAYFLYSSKIEARATERRLHNHFATQKSEHSKEWFNLSTEDLKMIISCLNQNSESKLDECAQTNEFWVGDENLWSNS